jgi:hypothetical protein
MTSALEKLFPKKTCTLEQAAQMALDIAVAEQLPISACYCDHPLSWHRQTILKTVPVYGMRQRRSERVPATAQFSAPDAECNAGTWSELTVKDADFQRYLDWLRTVW